MGVLCNALRDAANGMQHAISKNEGATCRFAARRIYLI
jgi:hypothetical protein